MKKVRFISALLAVMLAASSCGGSAPSGDTTPADASDTTAPEEKVGYPHGAADFGGYEFTFLNVAVCDWANRMLVPEESTGELLNDTMFDRNRRVEEMLNIKITEQNGADWQAVSDLIKAAVNSGDSSYDVAMTPYHFTGALLSDGYFADLAGIDSLHLNEAWWDQMVIQSATIKDHCYFATSDITFFPFEATWVIYFDKGRMADLGLEEPYGLVRDGKWTIDKLTEYALTAADLNGQPTFKYNQASGTARYGILSHDQFMEVLAFGFGETYLDESGDMPVFNEAEERLVTAFEKIMALTTPDGAFVDRNTDNIQGGGDRMPVEYKKGRIMMMAETLGHIANLRDASFDFGIVPIPKLDENQEQYHSMLASYGTLMTTIPKSCSDPERAGKVLDMLAYESNICMIEPYYDTYLTQKGVRDEDSADMLQLIRETRTLNIGKMFGWTTSVISSIGYALVDGRTTMVSTMASQKDSVNAAIASTYEALK
ncbi:MAG: extracellular solute-binding protein [Ruminococcaceae bacterium]|nr:extracellular solute-binding protein [Oscillospiraceae bacterium]